MSNKSKNIEFDTLEIKEECENIILNIKTKLICNQGYVVHMALQKLDAEMKRQS